MEPQTNIKRRPPMGTLSSILPPLNLPAAQTPIPIPHQGPALQHQGQTTIPHRSPTTFQQLNLMAIPHLDPLMTQHPGPMGIPQQSPMKPSPQGWTVALHQTPIAHQPQITIPMMAPRTMQRPVRSGLMIVIEAQRGGRNGRMEVWDHGEFLQKPLQVLKSGTSDMMQRRSPCQPCHLKTQMKCMHTHSPWRWH